MAQLIIYLHHYDKLLLNSIEEGRFLLDTLEKNQIPVPFQCRSGYCGVCRLYLLEGKVKYCQKPIAFIGRREILPCCCLPVNNIKLQLE